MVIWNGKGYLVAVATFIAALGAEYLSESYFADQTYFQTHGWPLGVSDAGEVHLQLNSPAFSSRRNSRLW